MHEMGEDGTIVLHRPVSAFFKRPLDDIGGEEGRNF